MIGRIKCLFGYHRFYIIQKLTDTSRKIGCKTCNKYFAMNDDAKAVLPWDEEFEKLYKDLGIL